MSLPVSPHAPPFVSRPAIPSVSAPVAVKPAVPVKEQKTASVQESHKRPDDGVTVKQSGKDNFSFLDFLDIVNPLQHIPFVNTAYRALTGDTIKSGARIVGGALFGGPIGAAVGGINAIAVNETGKDVGELALNKVGIGGADKAEKTETLIAGKTEKHEGKEIASFAHVSVAPVTESPFASVKATEIVWDDAPRTENIQTAALPQTKALNDLTPVAGFDPAFEAKEPGLENTQHAVDAPAFVNEAPPAPVENAQVPRHMMDALAKYQAMQNIGDKAVIGSTQQNASAGEAAKTRRPFAGLAQNVRHYTTN